MCSKYVFDFPFDGRFYLSYWNGAISLLLPFYFVVFYFLAGCYLYSSMQVFSFIFFSRQELTRLLSGLVALVIRKVAFGFFMELEIRGLGFRIFRDKVYGKLYRVYLGHSHWVYLFGSKNLIVKARKKTILFFSYDKSLLFDVLSQLFLMRKLNPYKLKGFIKPAMFFILKVTKQR